MKKFSRSIKIIITTIILSFVVLINPYSVNAASVTASGSNSVYVGGNITITVNANSSTDYYGVKAVINYSNLTYVSASPNSIWTSPDGVVRSGSQITFQGASLGSANKGSKKILSVTFKAPSKAGNASISISGDVKDGSGNSLNPTFNSLSIKVNELPASKPGNVAVSSPLIVDQNAWYLGKVVTLNWIKDEGVSDFSYILDSSPTTSPDDTSEGGLTTKDFNVDNGKYYFHIKAKNSVGWSNPTHFLIQIDNISPDPFSVTIKDDISGKKKIYFSTNDKDSGILKYQVSVNNVDLGDQVSGVLVDSTNLIKVTAFDKAGNTTISEALTIESTSSSTTSTNTKSSTTDVTINRTQLIIIILIPFIFLIPILAILGINVIKKRKQVVVKEDLLSKGN